VAQEPSQVHRGDGRLWKQTSTSLDATIVPTQQKRKATFPELDERYSLCQISARIAFDGTTRQRSLGWEHNSMKALGDPAGLLLRNPYDLNHRHL
jgi:hypothetical protein